MRAVGPVSRDNSGRLFGVGRSRRRRHPGSDYDMLKWRWSGVPAAQISRVGTLGRTGPFAVERVPKHPACTETWYYFKLEQQLPRLADPEQEEALLASNREKHRECLGACVRHLKICFASTPLMAC